MKKETTKITESQLRQIIRESISNILKEQSLNEIGWDIDDKDENGESYIGRSLDNVMNDFKKRGFKFFPSMEKRDSNGNLLTTLMSKNSKVCITSKPKNGDFIVMNVRGNGESYYNFL